MPHSQELSNNLYPSRNNPIPCIDTYLRYILILSSHPCLSLPIGLFFIKLSVEILKALLSSCILAIWPTDLNLLDLITLITLVERYKLRSSSLWSLLYYSFSPPRILFSNTLTCIPLLKRTCFITIPNNCNIIVSYILVFKFLEKNWEDRSFWTEY